MISPAKIQIFKVTRSEKFEIFENFGKTVHRGFQRIKGLMDWEQGRPDLGRETVVSRSRYSQFQSET